MKTFISKKDLDNAHFNLMSMRDLLLNKEAYEDVEKIEKLLYALETGMTIKQWNEIQEVVIVREMIRDKEQIK